VEVSDSIPLNSTIDDNNLSESCEDNNKNRSLEVKAYRAMDIMLEVPSSQLRPPFCVVPGERGGRFRLRDQAFGRSYDPAVSRFLRSGIADHRHAFADRVSNHDILPNG
jgi:hypothetical protein